MKLRIELTWRGEPFRRKNVVNKFCVIDMIFGLAMVVLYSYKLMFPDHDPSLSEMEGRYKVQAMMFLFFLIAVNLVQFVRALRLHRITSFENPHPVKCYRRAKEWFDFSESIVVCAFVKTVIELGYLYSEAVNPFMIILTTLNTLEAPIKLMALIRVSRMMKDLRATLQYYPVVSFVPVDGKSNENPNFNDKYMYEYDGMTFTGDINANSEVV